MQRVETTVRTVLSLLDALNRGAFEQAAERIAPDCVLINTGTGSCRPPICGP
ncbi:MAG: hypothetical protein ONA69_00400 [candidate division KSB1 bacterium]|nr:hypothetical protein [candidate division KSB1 bacterium]